MLISDKGKGILYTGYLVRGFLCLLFKGYRRILSVCKVTEE